MHWKKLTTRFLNKNQFLCFVSCVFHFFRFPLCIPPWLLCTICFPCRGYFLRAAVHPDFVLFRMAFYSVLSLKTKSTVVIRERTDLHPLASASPIGEKQQSCMCSTITTVVYYYSKRPKSQKSNLQLWLRSITHVVHRCYLYN